MVTADEKTKKLALSERFSVAEQPVFALRAHGERVRSRQRIPTSVVCEFVTAFPFSALLPVCTSRRLSPIPVFVVLFD
jgi:hypothetical protein